MIAMYDITKLGNDYKIENIVKDYQDKYPLARDKSTPSSTPTPVNTNGGVNNINETEEKKDEKREEKKEDRKEGRKDDDRSIKRKKNSDNSIVEKKK
jgi:hypothetical protein